MSDLLGLLLTSLVEIWAKVTPYWPKWRENVGKDGDRDQVGKWKHRRWK